jgi:hypothetical protein
LVEKNSTTGWERQGGQRHGQQLFVQEGSLIRIRQDKSIQCNDLNGTGRLSCHSNTTSSRACLAR